VARAVEWQWIGGELVVARLRSLVVEWRWWSSGGWRSGRWRSSGGGGGGEGSGKGDLSAVVVARAVELRWIGGGAVGGLAVDWWWQG
jgi:hypothetical protein